jgi:dihydroorotate dehydrogenase (fumarate)
MIKYILAGADVAMCASSLLRHGIPWIKETLADFELYMKDMPFNSVDSFKGSMSQQHIADPTAYERSNYLQIMEGKHLK